MIRTVLVVIPAKDEQALVGACLTAVAAARAQVQARVDRELTVRTVVVLDRCRDATARIAEDHGVETVVVDCGRVGAVRAAGVAHALAVPAATVASIATADPVMADAALHEVWIASTDADSRVPENWLTAMVGAADAGIDVVVGTVRPDLARTSALYRQWRRQYLIADGHPHVHGANLGLRADVYLRLGGWPAVATHEDVRLVARAQASPGVRILRTGGIPVVTSGRLSGRVTHGFAGYLRRLPIRPAASTASTDAVAR